MGKAILENLLGIVFSIIIVTLISASLFTTYGWAVVVIPASLIGGGLLLFWGVSRFMTRKKRRALNLAATRRRTAELEAALGMPLYTDGVCPTCEAPLLLGAEFCSQCGQRLAMPQAHGAICDTCQTRNLDGARFCGACGSPLRALPPPQRAQTPGA